MIPYHDENQTQRTAYVTLLFVAACVAAWVFVQGAGAEVPVARSVCNYGLIPGELTENLRPGRGVPMGNGLFCAVDPGPQYPNVLTSMFLHGSWMHLIGNMWFLWLFGNNVEDAMTRPRFAAFYLLCGLAAALAQVMADPSSPIPMVGASGAISGVMGGYLLLFPHVRVYVMAFYATFAVPAWLMLVYWMGLQFLGSFSQPTEGGGVAYWAHIGGFLAGVVLVKLFKRTDRLIEHSQQHWRPRQAGWR